MENKTLRKYPDLIHYRRKNRIIPFVYSAIYYIVLGAVFVWCYFLGLYENHWLFYTIVTALILLPFVLFKPFSFLFEKDYKGRITKKEYSNEATDSEGVSSGINRYRFEKEIVEHIILLENGKSIDYSISNDSFDYSEKEMGVNFGNMKEAPFDFRKGMKFVQGYPLVTSPLRDYYNLGDEVEHFAGFYYNRKLNLKHDEKNICIVCGTLNLSKDGNCINCGHSIVK